MEKLIKHTNGQWELLGNILDDMTDETESNALDDLKKSYDARSSKS